MPYLTEREKAKHRSWLEAWHPPTETKEYVESVMDYMATDTHGIPEALFNQAGVDFLLEAFAAADFAKIRGVAAIRLIPDNRPDFELRTSLGDETWEFTEADVPGRRRGQEYREAAKRAAEGLSTVENDPVDNWHIRADHAVPTMLERAARKARKGYTPDTKLLIYLNINEFGIRQKEIEAAMQDATAPAKSAFAEVWVLWKSQAFRLWTDGAPTFTRYGSALSAIA